MSILFADDSDFAGEDLQRAVDADRERAVHTASRYAARVDLEAADAASSVRVAARIVLILLVGTLACLAAVVLAMTWAPGAKP